MRRALLMLLSGAMAANAQEPAAPGAVAPAAAVQLPPDWAERDLEGKWVAYRRAVEQAADANQAADAFAWALRRAGEVELLELIAINEGWRFAGPHLVAMDAPQFVRCAVWNLGAFDSHAQDAAKKALLAYPARTLGWFDAFPTAAVDLGLALRDELRSSGVEPQRDPRDLPPLDPMPRIAPWLDAPAELQPFGDRQTAERRVRYEHQVLRALGAVLIGGDRDSRIVSKVVRLTGHGNARVRQAAFDTLAKLPAGMVPFAAMAHMAQDDQEVAARRRSAVVVLSFSSHPAAMELLVRLALDPAHPAHTVAVTRLSETGDPVGVDGLRQAHVATAEHERVIDQIVMAAEQRHRQGSLMLPLELRRVLLRVAWLRELGDARAEAVAAATADMLRRGTPGDVPAALAAFLKLPSPPSPFPPDLAARVEVQLRRFVDQLLQK